MNLSGRAVKYWLDKEKLLVDQILVIVDELALPLSKIRLRPGGSDAGHNGLKSVFEHLGTHEYPKLRFGIGSDFPKGMQVDYVLGQWRQEETPIVKQKIEKCAEVIRMFATIGIAKTMNEVNKLEFGVSTS
jgi:PTH1 family peptidyl-tRNA hydrolase